MKAIYSHCPLGYEGYLVHIEVDIRPGIPGMDIVGLPDTAVRESKERVRIALKRSDFDFPRGRIVVNLAPAGIKKLGARFDLSIALAVLAASEQVDIGEEPLLVLGELELSGRIRPVPGCLGALNCASLEGISLLILPEANREQASLFGEGRIILAATLRETVSRIKNRKISAIGKWELPQGAQRAPLEQVKGQRALKRALVIAGAGFHNMLFFGPPGGGKTMAANRLPGLLPEMAENEVREVSQIHSLKSAHNSQQLVVHRPFRTPHHTSSREGLVGGGRDLSPGEVSLAHRGVLFLDEAPEFKTPFLQALREPLESGRVDLARAGREFWYPSDFQLVMTANPCPCGNLGKEDARCFCSQREVEGYWRRLGGPLLDRIDIRWPVVPVNQEELLGPEDSFYTTPNIRNRIREAWNRQQYRNQGRLNARLGAEDITKMVKMGSQTEAAFFQAVKKAGLSSRAVLSVLKVALTIYDFDGRNTLGREELFEAIRFRHYGNQPGWPLKVYQ